ncbi:MAG: DUF1553 domain-containing protein [Planctomycetes bacterium]|nr:DUF1553 domain-containing protein [Planctomycetota bacterium]
MKYRSRIFLVSCAVAMLLHGKTLQRKEPTPHWSFQPIARPALPPTKNATWKRNAIDAFILANLEVSGLTPSTEADKTLLIRRLKFDLLGLPPTPEEVDAFIKDAAPDAYEKLVDQYLASPHFGERWARHWLDVVRFAESDGFEMNQARPNAWPFRDYVIRSFNDDKPYDRFVREQIAGDVFQADAATAFLVGGPFDKVKSPDPVLTQQQRADELHDMVSTTAATFLGLTVGCARCHDHKFDPISMKDYYGIKAMFAGVQHGERAFPTNTEESRVHQLEALKKERASLAVLLAATEPFADPKATAKRRPPVNARMNTERFKPVLAKFVRFTVLATNGGEPCLDELEIFSAGAKSSNVALGGVATSSGNFPSHPIHKLEHINNGRFGNSQSWISNQAGKGWIQIELKEPATIDRIVWGRDREGKFNDRVAVRYQIEIALEAGQWQSVAGSNDRAGFGEPDPMTPPGETEAEREAWKRNAARQAELTRQIAALERPAMAYLGRFTNPEATHLLNRGDATQKLQAIPPAALASFAPKLQLATNASDHDRRKALAEWITDPANPLTARVIVNRLWHYHFGTGIVATPSDFGKNGGTPSHPELLDWLASELVERKWSLKQIHRLIVTSATYRQSSAANPNALAKDAQGRLLWRYPPRRLEAEALRDSILFVSGKLETSMGGPGFDLFEPNGNYVKVYTSKKEFGPAEFRRMIYQSKPRMHVDNTFGAFDCPDSGQIAPKRTSSTTPLQSLNLLNSPFLLQQAKFLAERIEKNAGNDTTQQVRWAFRLAFQREPTANESAAALILVREHGLSALCRALFNANEFLFVF